MEQKNIHILVGLSPSPTNARIVRTAAGMAEAFGGRFTALYVQTQAAGRMTEADKKRLQANIRLAEKSGATVATVYGDDVSYQIAEFARLSRVTTIVIGRSNAARRHFWSKPTLTEKLTEIAPNMDIHIIPDSASETSYHAQKENFEKPTIPTLKDLAITFLILVAATVIGSIFRELGFTEANIITVYLLGVLLNALCTKSHICSGIGSLASVLVFNFFFTEPHLTLHAYEPGYPVTFAVMFIASLITGSLANRLKNHAKLAAQSAWRTQVLFDTNQLLQKEQDDGAIIRITAEQLAKLLDRGVIAYPEQDGALGEGYVPRAAEESGDDPFGAEYEREVAARVLKNGKRAGAMTGTDKDARGQYLAIRMNGTVYGVVGIDLSGGPLDSFENSVLLSILGECALAIENNRNAREKEQAAVLAKNEQLRANLLRTISHDLRTPLTSISGNADYLLACYDRLDDETRTQIFTDIHDDAEWLTSLVENLLSVTRLEGGNVNLHMSTELIEEVAEEALKHVRRKCADHVLRFEAKDELLLSRIDPRLIMQVIVNLVDNAAKYTPAGSEITVTAGRQDGMIAVSVADNGPGIPDDKKERVFEMFFTGENKVADSRRSLGLGLALCRSIIGAHGGTITLTDNVPHGCIFTFTLPSSEVNLHA